MQLSNKLLAELKGRPVEVPEESLLHLPEKVLQFGTGVLLRGLPDYFIDKANKNNIFNGRVVVIKSTGNGGTNEFTEQHGLYTLLERGVKEGVLSEVNIINASISRVLSAAEQWDAILACAADPAIQIVISNTTEVGITLLEADVENTVPVSFPGRLLHILLHRYNTLGGTIDAGFVVVPTELITDNGTKLKQIVLELAARKHLPVAFINWVEHYNDFCNSLVDCIVPGKLTQAEQKKAEEKLGYQDSLMIMSEPYRLWAIETKSERTRAILSFSLIDKAVIITPDINKYRELKLRLLNGAHTFSCGLAFLAGFKTVKDAMNDKYFSLFINHLMLQEIAPLVVSNTITLAEAQTFAEQILDRFSNPFIEHLWLNISVQYTSKMNMRTIPLVKKHFTLHQYVPSLMALGVAAFILFMRVQKQTGTHYFGEVNGETYPIQDDKAILLYEKWNKEQTATLVTEILKDTSIFEEDISECPGFAETVNGYLSLLMEQGASACLHAVITKK
jgi:tagaturonate reductase